MRKVKISILGLGLMATQLVSCNSLDSTIRERSEESSVTMAQLPSSIQKVMAAELQSAKIVEVEKEFEDGEVIFKITTSADMVYFYSEGGNLLHKSKVTHTRPEEDHDADEMEESIPLKQLPSIVKAAVDKHVKGEIEEIEKETEDGVVYYEVEVNQNGEEVEYKFSASGKLLEVERD